MLPIKIKDGRLKMLSGDDYIKQLVMIALQDGDSENPFQDLGLSEFMIFDINAEAVEGEIRHRVQNSFDALKRSQLAKLTRGAQSIRFETEGADKFMYIDYTDLETGERTELEVPLPPVGE